MRASVCAPGLSAFREARGCQLAAGAPPSGPPAPRSGPSFLPRSPLPGGPGAGTPRRSKRQRQQRVREPRAPRCPRGPSRAAPAPVRSRRPRFPPGHALSKLCCCGRRGGERSRPANGREGGAGAGPGRARAARGSESGGPGPRPHHAPARRRRRRRLGRRQRRLGGRGSRRRGRPRGQRRADPLPGRGRRGAGAEQRQRVGAAGPGRSQVVPGQRVGEPEQQLGLGGKEAPAADPGDPGPAPAHPPSPLCLLRRRRGARSPPGTLSRSHGTILPKVRAGPGCPRLPAPQRSAPRLGSRSVPLAPVAVPLLFAPVGLSSPGARVGGARIPGSHPGTPDQGGVPRAPASPPLWFYRQ